MAQDLAPCLAEAGISAAPLHPIPILVLVGMICRPSTFLLKDLPWKPDRFFKKYLKKHGYLE